MSVIRCRKLDANGDLVRGKGKDDFITDGDAVVQILRQRLRMFKGEWWENQDAGMAKISDLLGRYGIGSDTRPVDSLIQDTILSTPYVTGIASMSSSYVNRKYSFSATVNTAFGQIIVANG